MTIYKYPLEVTREQYVELPQGAHILTCQLQHNQPTMWVLVEPMEKKEKKKILMFGTGWNIDATNISHIGTVLSDGLVWHYFEEW